MARKWRDIRAEIVEAGLVSSQEIDAATKLMRGEVRAHRLSEVRRAQHITQQAIADSMGVKQPRVSAIERGSLSSTELGTLEAYVRALGGNVRVVADFGDETILLRD